MGKEVTAIAKITRPRCGEPFPRTRLFRLLDAGRKRPVTWVTAPAGAGKTTLIASWLDSRKLPCIWYQIDEGDSDIATFFYYLGLAAKKAAPRYRTPLPLLTPEYLMGLSTFTKRWFENLFTRLKLPCVLVFDNYQNVPLDSGLHEVIRDCLSIVPNGIQVIVISRSEPPPGLARLGVSDDMAVVGWENVRFTLDESKAVVRARERLSDDAVRKLHDATGGWAAGLVLMMTREENAPAGPDAAGAFFTEKVFDYFAGEVFDKLDSETRDFLLTASFLPRMTPETTAKLTDNEQAGRILSGLRRNHFFTEQHSTAEAVYQFHPLFRSFLLTRVKESLSRDGVVRVQNRAAALLVETGQLEDAVGLYLETASWEPAIRLILGHAQALVMQGRNKTLETWLNGIPREIADATPWLLFWKGTCCLPFEPDESRKYFERAFALFKAGDDPAGSFLSCAGVINTYLFTWDTFTPLTQWIKECEDLLKQYGDFPGREIETQVTFSMFAAIFIHQPQHPHLDWWERKAKTIMQACPDNNLRVIIGSQLLWYYTIESRISDAASALNQVRPLLRLREITPLNKIMWYSIEAVYGWVTASFDICTNAVKTGLEISDATGVVVMKNKLFAQAVYHSTITGDCKASSDYLKKLASATDFRRRIDAGHYYHLASLDAFCRNDHRGALEFIRKAVDLVADRGMPFAELICRTGLARALFHAGDNAEAGHQLAKAHALAKDLHALPLEFSCLVMESRLSSSKANGGSEKEALETLRRATSMGREHHIMNISMLPRSDFAWLCATALEAGIEREYVQELVRKHKLTPPDAIAEFGVRDAESREQRAMGKPYALALEAWPWPVKIYTLGRFALVINGQPVELSGKGQPKPLLMLKALIAFGGQDVSEDRLTDALWPDADGDVARKSFDTTLHRLRKLIGNDKAIVINEGRLSLDDRQVWMDARAFEKLVQDVMQSGEFGVWSSESGKNKSAIERAVALYRGHFLQTDTRQSWPVSMRERLRSKFLNLIVGIGQHWEHKGRFAKAIEWFRKGLAIDELAEVFYQHLMVCYQKMGQEAEAVAVYKRCRSMLSESLGIGPSSRTEEIYNRLRTRPD